MVDRTSLYNFVPGTSYLVHVTHINDPGSFYVRLASLSGFVERLEKKGKSIASEDIKTRRRVIYHSLTIKKFIRGDIDVVNKGGTTCVITAIDYGFVDRNVPVKDIYVPHTSSAESCPPIAAHCELDFCRPIGDNFDDNAIETMKYFVGKHPAQMIMKCKLQSKFKVELRTIECPDNLSSMLAYMECSLLTGGRNSISRFNCPNIAVLLRYKQKTVNVGERFSVRVQYGNSLSDFYVAEVNEFKKYNSESCTFTEYCKRQPLQNVNVAVNDSRCSAAWVGMQSKYERVIVKEITEPEEKCLVYLIDWGTEKEVSFEHVKQVSSIAYTEQPALAMHCSTEDRPWNNRLPKFLYPGYQFIIEILEEGNDERPHKVKMFRSPNM